jgi:hypothetical protein
MNTKKATALPTLSRKQLAYCTLRAQGESKSQAYLLSGYKAPDVQQAGSAACKLEKHPAVSSYLNTIKTSVAVQNVLTVESKRRFLHDIVHANPADPALAGHLIQEIREEVDAEGRVKKVIKLPSKLEAINIDNKMTAVYSDKSGDAPVNQFQFLIALGRAGNLGELGGPGVPAIDAVTMPARVDDAEPVR